MVACRGMYTSDLQLVSTEYLFDYRMEIRKELT